MPQEQEHRFELMRTLAEEAQAAISAIQDTAETHLNEVDNDSSAQAESLQRISQSAGTGVEALREIAELARQSRSYQAQAHQEHSSDRPQ